MSGDDRHRGSSAAEDPLSADRRTLLIAAVAMVVLIAVGVASAAMFTSSACGLVVPEPVEAGRADGDVTAVLAGALPGLDDGTVEAVAAELEQLAGAVPEGVPVSWPGRAVGAVDVGPATGLTVVDGQLLATGPRLTVLPPPAPDATPDATPDAGPAAELDEAAVVVGDGERVYSLAEVHEPTGQISSVVPVDADLDAGDCYDTAQVGVALAFHLDAGDGQLLLLRSDDNGEHPEVEVRDADGSVWSERVQLGAGPAGGLAARLDGRLGDDHVVTARRSRPDDSAPALQARARDRGVEQWSVTPAEVAQRMPPGDEALEIEVVAITDDLVLTAVSREGGDAVLLLAFDLDDGAWAWTSELDAEAVPRWVGEADGAAQLLVPRLADGEVSGHELVAVDPATGDVSVRHGLDGAAASAASGRAGLLAAADGDMVAVGTDAPPRSAQLPVAVADLAVVGESTAVLLRDGEDGAVVWLTP